MMDGAHNVKNYKDVVMETNTTITKHNMKHLQAMAKLFVKLGMLSSEFIFVFPHGNALVNFEDVVPKYTEAAPYMKEAVDIGKDSETRILMRYVPFCVMRGYESYIAELYDPSEREQVGPGVETLDVIKARRDLDRAQVPQCRECSYQTFCEGPWKVYPRFRGAGEFRPVKGNKLAAEEVKASW
jgi:MoaA/NifB/PqqE/SkfB family radical SAM enzyme